nr:MAG TPA: hypothetical protein [Caudoviricetes sp.]
MLPCKPLWHSGLSGIHLQKSSVFLSLRLTLFLLFKNTVLPAPYTTADCYRDERRC